MFNIGKQVRLLVDVNSSLPEGSIAVIHEAIEFPLDGYLVSPIGKGIYSSDTGWVSTKNVVLLEDEKPVEKIKLVPEFKKWLNGNE